MPEDTVGGFVQCARSDSVVVRATHVVAALGAYQLAVVPGEPVPAGGAHLAMMIHRRWFSLSAGRTTL